MKPMTALCFVEKAMPQKIPDRKKYFISFVSCHIMIEKKDKIT